MHRNRIEYDDDNNKIGHTHIVRCSFSFLSFRVRISVYFTRKKKFINTLIEVNGWKANVVQTAY